MPDFSKEITIIVGDESAPSLHTKLTVHESFLVEKSEFFQAACRNEWKETTSRIIILPEVEIDTFRAYLFWVYREQVPIHHKVDSPGYGFQTIGTLVKLFGVS